MIKIESRKRPDMVRVIPPFAQDQPLESLYAHTTMRDHLGITLDLGTAQGQALARDLVKSADVVIENFSPRVMRRYGLDYQNIRAVRPDVVMVSLTGAGQTGPQSQMTTYGTVITSIAGIDSYQGYLGDEHPSAFGTAITDPLVGVMGAFAVLAALRHRSRTGKGQHVDLSQWEAVASTIGGPLMDSVFNGRTQTPLGNRDPMMAPHGVYPCKGDDRWVSVGVKTDEEWRGLCDAMGQPDLARDKRFADGYRRQRHHDELDTLVGAWTSKLKPVQVTRALQKAGIAAFPALAANEVFTDKHYKYRGDFIEVEHRLGKEVIYEVPWKLSKTPGGVRRAAPSIGQDNQQVYSEILGLSEEQIGGLERDGVLY